MEHRVMNCRDWDGDQLGPGWCSIKYDGLRGFYYPGHPHIMSRDFKPYFGLSHLVKALDGFRYALDVELDIPEMEFNKKSGIIRSYDDTPEVIARVIDTPGCPGQIETRLAVRPHIPGLVIPIEHIWYNDKSQDLMYEMALNAGYEGIVWKPAYSPYRNTRGIWVRRVPVHSVDCQCIGIYEGKGKLTGVAGGIIVLFKGLECKVGTMFGVDYTERFNMFCTPVAYIGRTAVIEYKELQPSGKPRQPRFKAWRYDKEADA